MEKVNMKIGNDREQVSLLPSWRDQTLLTSFSTHTHSASLYPLPFTFSFLTAISLMLMIRVIPHDFYDLKK